MALVRRTAPLTRLVPLVALALLAAVPAHALKVATWNLWEYPTSLLSTRQPNMRIVMAGLNPDIIMVQELAEDGTNAPRDTFMNVLRAALPARHWGASPLLTGTQSVIYWDSLAVDVSSFTAITTGGPRMVLRGTVKPLGYVSKEAWFRLYSFHLKAGNTVADANTRAAECSSLRTSINTASIVNFGPNFLVGGDSNFYTADEVGYVNLTQSGTNNNGRGKDPLTMPGNWHVNAGYAIHMTQCPCNTGCLAGFSGGGLDDRFDLVFSSYSMQDGQGLELVPYASGGYGAYGNDGFHFNANIDDFTNFAVGPIIATALRNASDHIPVFAIVQLPARVVAASALDFGAVLVGAGVTQPLSVGNGAVAPADGLTYSLVAPAGFSAPGGTFEAAAGAAANEHLVGLDTATRGSRNDTLTIHSDAPDSSAKGVLLSGTVLSHAVPSLDSLAVVVEDTLDLGEHATGDFADGAVRVHDQAWDALTARLAVGAADIAGGAGRFSLVGGFSPLLIGGTGHAWQVHFDAAGAVADSIYSATLTFTCADEPLPGAVAAPALVVHLLARPLSGSGAVGDGPSALRFAPARPNPSQGATRFAFELPHAAPVTLELFDLSGRRVATLAQGVIDAGRHEAWWNGREESGARAAAGLYFARFVTPGLTRSTRLVLLP